VIYFYAAISSSKLKTSVHLPLFAMIVYTVNKVVLLTSLQLPVEYETESSHAPRLIPIRVTMPKVSSTLICRQPCMRLL